ncbi:hypothetical protein [Ovoidimarina sediminis]|uniref:hypothetical protein n=1 Tax=Ovoidimarina sediminis TaxID=3079856 RepID=UPI002906BC0E|nr:hypothetical protein [Rhodophyticola sp. MJ-SS7]MDU8945544.1 hypothetical protein [Rhodophyticola sp. MJ-SS7]
MTPNFLRLGTATAFILAMTTSTGFAATFSELDTNGDEVLTEEEFVEVLGPHHGAIAYRQYNTNPEPVTVEVEQEVQATDPETGELLYEQGAPIMVEGIDANGEPAMVQATDPDTGDPLYEKGEPIMTTETVDVEIEGVTVDEIRRSERGFERSNAGKAGAYANKQQAEDNKANAGSKSSKSASASSKSKKGGKAKGKNK